MGNKSMIEYKEGFISKIKNFFKKVIDKYREWCYCMVVQNNKRKTKQRRLPTSSLCFFVFYFYIIAE